MVSPMPFNHMNKLQSSEENDRADIHSSIFTLLQSQISFFNSYKEQEEKYTDEREIKCEGIRPTGECGNFHIIIVYTRNFLSLKKVHVLPP